jgi:2-polyprenyl-3-methyl-5-hydroxy-6-metoxy-1,4-benzoquinol methylase
MTDDKKIKHWDDMYQMPLEDIPWEIKEPPRELVELVDSGQIKSGRALDIACGTGNYSLYLARNGFDVTGIDFSKRAIAMAIRNSGAIKLPIHFIVGNIQSLESLLKDFDRFDFILDYSIFHHLEPAITVDYARQCTNLLKPGGKLLLVCYSDKDEFASGKRTATGKYGNKMFYRTKEEIRNAYSGLKELSYKETRLGKRQQHIAHCFLFEKS